MTNLYMTFRIVVVKFETRPSSLCNSEMANYSVRLIEGVRLIGVRPVEVLLYFNLVSPRYR